MKVILVNPPSDTYRNPEEHLGLSHLKSYLSLNAYNVEIIDGYLCGLKTEDIVKDIIGDNDCKIVGISPSIDSLKYALDISEQIKNKRCDIHICWGGHLATFSAYELLINHAFISSIVMGEGEQTFMELVNALSEDKILGNNIKGLAFKDVKSNKVIVSPSRSLIEDLDTLPFPDRLNSTVSYKSGALIQISGSRGCYGNCSFCSINSIYRMSDGKTWRGRSPESIVDELIYLYNKYGFNSFKFVDDSFFGPETNWRDRGLKLAEGIMKAGIKIKFRISIRANNVDREVFLKMKEAGLYAVSIGIESGVQRMLDTFNKGLAVEQNLNALKILKELKIITLMGFIGFDPYVTINEIDQNISFLNRHKFVLTDLLSKSLFVHANDSITKKLLKDRLITGRHFPNYTYKIVDEKAALVLKMIEKWDSNNKQVYYKISDPITAPRQTESKEEELIMRLFRKIRKIDFIIFKKIVEMVKIGYNEAEIIIYLEKKQIEYLPAWNQAIVTFSNLRLKL